MFSHATLTGRLAQTVGLGPAASPLTWRICHAARDLLAADYAFDNRTELRRLADGVITHQLDFSRL